MILIAAAKILDLWRRDERKLDTIDLLKNAAIIRATITQEKSRETLEKLTFKRDCFSLRLSAIKHAAIKRNKRALAEDNAISDDLINPSLCHLFEGVGSDRACVLISHVVG